MVHSPETLGSALKSCNAHWLTEAVIRFYSGWTITPDQMGHERFAAVERKIEGSLQCMQQTLSTPWPKRRSSNITQSAEEPADCEPMTPMRLESARLFIPCWQYDLSQTRLCPRMGFLWIIESDLVALLEELADEGVLAKAPELAAVDQIYWGQRLAALDERIRPVLFSEPWPRVLNDRLLLQGKLSPFEWHWCLSGIFWAITERGFENPDPEPITVASLPADRALEVLEAQKTAAFFDKSRSAGCDDVDDFKSAYEEWIQAQAIFFNGQAHWRLLKMLADHFNDAETIKP